MFDRRRCYWEIRAAKNTGAAHAKLKVGCRLKVDLETVDQRLLRKRPPKREDFTDRRILGVDPMETGHFADPVLGAEWSQQLAQNPGNFDG